MLSRLPHPSPLLFLAGAALLISSEVLAGARVPGNPIVTKEFVAGELPTPSSHASTIAETSSGLVAAWFGGTHEKHDDVGIWVARKTGDTWSKPQLVDDGVRDGRDFPCWNPVLFQMPKGDLLLFFKVGPHPQNWWGELCRSSDDGKSWSEPERLPDGILGPVRNAAVLLTNGTLVCGSSTEQDGWKVHVEFTSDGGQTWTKTETIPGSDTFEAIQPTLLNTKTGLVMLCRARRAGQVLRSESNDGGKTWLTMQPTGLPHNNSGLHGLTLDDGRHLLVYNHTRRGRTPLNLALSTGDGTEWSAAVVLESQPGEYSYPFAIQTSDGLVHLTYTHKRTCVRHVVIDPEKLTGVPVKNGRWPESVKP